jgi:hypothetical protein
MARTSSTLLTAGLLTAALAAQSVCEGSGPGQVYIRNTPATLGTTARIDFGSAIAPGGLGFLSISGGFGPTVSPYVGPVCLDVASPIYTVLFYLLDGTGNATFRFPVGSDPAAVGFPPLFLNGATLDPATLAFSLSKTVRLQWEAPNGFDLLPAMASTRALHTATALYRTPTDNRHEVLIAGGATGSIVATVSSAATELFSPISRTFRAGPTMSEPRSGHRSVLLLDGRVLITGGAATGNIGTATCEIFDPTTGQLTATAPMSSTRLAHAISLLDDGRVLVSGGFATWQNAASQFTATLNTVQDSTEIYDPATDTWSPGPVMASRRAGHTQTRLPDGRILIVAGVNGGITTPYPLSPNVMIQIPLFTPSCEYFDPATNALSPAPGIPVTNPLPNNQFGRGFHAASLLPNGDVLVTGGAATIGQYNVAACTNDCRVLTPSGWVQTASLSTGVAFHTQVTDPATGHAIVMGGFTAEFGFSPATADVGVHDGTTFTSLTPLGEHPVLTQPAAARAAHTCTPLQDGTFLVAGGQNPTISIVTAFGDAFVYVR